MSQIIKKKLKANPPRRYINKKSKNSTIEEEEGFIEGKKENEEEEEFIEEKKDYEIERKRFEEFMEKERIRIIAYNYDNELGESSSEEMEDDYNNYKNITMKKLINSYDDDNDYELDENSLKDKKDDLIEVNDNNLSINKISNQKNNSLMESSYKEKLDESQLINFEPKSEEKNSINNSDSFSDNNRSNINDANESEIMTINERKNKKNENNDEENNINSNGEKNKKTTINLSSTLKKRKENIKNIKDKPKMDLDETF